MSHFAEIDKNGVVLRVIVAEQDFIDTLPGTYVQTSYNATIRKNFAGLGFTFDKTRDAFIPPQPFPSWTLNEETCRWEAPVAMPDDGGYHEWDEANGVWL